MSTTTTDAFGVKVEEYRERLGLLQKELAGKVGLSPSHLNRIEKGTRKRPAVETVRRMIKALRLTQSEAKELVQLAKLSPLILQVGALGSGVGLGATLPPSRTGQRQTDTASQQRDQTIGLLVEQAMDEAQLTPEKRILAERLILENARSVCEVLAKEQDKQRR